MLRRNPHPDNPFSTFGPRKKPMAKVSTKQAKLNRDTRGIRRANIERGVLCEFCGDAIAVDCHEIAGGMSRHLAVWEPHQQMDTCRKCHEEYQGLPYALQIALKAKAAIRAVNRCRGCKAVSAEKVAMYLTKD